MDEAGIHNAPNTQRDYLFEDNQGQEVYQGNMGTDTSNISWENIDILIGQDEIEQIFYDLINETGEVYSWTMGTWIQSTGTIGKTYSWSLDCIAPRGENVKNKDFVLAYEQRKDVNSICDIEKRVCMSWTLWWSFTQDSCKDDVVYEYRKTEVISYNQKVLNEYIQPNAPINSWAEFDTEGKINSTETPPIDTRGTTNSPVKTDPEVSQTVPSAKRSCTTVRGQEIENGQFVKAYKSPRGFIDLECKVQIRPCVDGTLKWSYNYAKCTFNNTTYADYLTAGSPTSNTGFLFFERIKSILRRSR